VNSLASSCEHILFIDLVHFPSKALFYEYLSVEFKNNEKTLKVEKRSKFWENSQENLDFVNNS